MSLDQVNEIKKEKKRTEQRQEKDNTYNQQQPGNQVRGPSTHTMEKVLRTEQASSSEGRTYTDTHRDRRKRRRGRERKRRIQFTDAHASSPIFILALLVHFLFNWCSIDSILGYKSSVREKDDLGERGNPIRSASLKWIFLFVTLALARVLGLIAVTWTGSGRKKKKKEKGERERETRSMDTKQVSEDVSGIRWILFSSSVGMCNERVTSNSLLCKSCTTS